MYGGVCVWYMVCGVCNVVCVVVCDVCACAMVVIRCGTTLCVVQCSLLHSYFRHYITLKETFGASA